MLWFLLKTLIPHIIFQIQILTPRYLSLSLNLNSLKSLRRSSSIIRMKNTFGLHSLFVANGTNIKAHMKKDLLILIFWSISLLKKDDWP